ncbi:uncharacterized protein MYCFIDRAFT_72425 [Pseudocercospora fijiensis CIRAD86]|uniref:FAD-binding domain-containing protein n=1 Tax=Pseudocercospora fijiensis (strain CIRAD86) TaxID=383855 RepID=M2YHP0_PSEFD|nr:uncharacterized protein MYCFIDRAFT_72425 [Pseudocercospora fijiensis CIRAD86]EME77310.1 hypothetical protein MYCFIDRAFT_72425 [Pseudocercospora fijiensis CIRAD86]
MAQTSKKFEVAIIGGGISGLTLGIALHHRGIPTRIYEQAPEFAEIGAGVSFRENAIQAMEHCHPGIFEAFEKVRVSNLWPSKKTVWFDYHDGYHDKSSSETFAFSIRTKLGQAGVHRAHFLNELVGLFPAERSHFGKRLEGLEREEDGRWRLRFVDGSSAVADAVIGCDGIKSKVRVLMFGEEHPCARPTYTHKYAYRGLTDMEDAVKAVGEEKAKTACMHMGPGGHLLTFPVNKGKTVNIVAFKTNPEDWPDHDRLVRRANRDDALRDFQDYGHDVLSLLKLCKPDLDVWGIFHLADHPVPSFAKGSICLVGDAAHATSPHHGAGAGFCIEDAAILADLLADKRVKTREHVEAVFAAFDDVRRDRGQWLPPSSQHIGNCYEWIAEGVGEDFEKIETEINVRNGIIADVDIPGMCRDARECLTQRLQASGRL